jgi:hypothetical protein
MTLSLLILHGLVGVALLGAITHQAVAMLRTPGARGTSFAARYSAVPHGGFTGAVALLFVVEVALGALIYPDYRLDVRIPFEEMALGWAVGLFEVKEHFGGIALGVLPLYAWLHRSGAAAARGADRTAVTLLLAFVVWFDFLTGHVLNNLRGLG